MLQCDRLFLGQALTFQSVCGCRTLLTKIRYTPLSVTFAELFLHLSEATTVWASGVYIRSQSWIDLATEEAPEWTNYFISLLDQTKLICCFY